MAIDERIVAAVTPIVPVCVPDEYDPGSGEAAEVYCTYNFDRQAIVYGDDAPVAVQSLVQVHWWAPLGLRPWPTIQSLCRAILAAGFTYPRVENASDATGQHYVFEFEDADGEI